LLLHGVARQRLSIHEELPASVVFVELDDGGRRIFVHAVRFGADERQVERQQWEVG